MKAKLLRRWVVKATQRSGPLRSKTTALANVHNHPTFIPVNLTHRCQHVPHQPTSAWTCNTVRHRAHPVAAAGIKPMRPMAAEVLA
jgi:hypothetical protein